MTEVHRPGCYNRKPSEPTHIAQDGYTTMRLADGKVYRVAVWVEVPHVFDDACQFSKTSYLPGCTGCKLNLTNLTEKP